MEEENLMNDKVVRPLFKNSKVGKKLVSRIISEVLEVDYEDIYNNIELLNDDMIFSSKARDGRTDVMLETNKYYINIEICYSKGTTRERQMDSYIYSIFFKEAIKSDKLQNMKNIIQIMLENYDYFHKNKFCYKVIPMESELHIPDDPFIVRYHFNLALIRKMKYTSIRNEKDALKKILYMFVCQNEDLEKAYMGDKFMEEVVKIAREISGREKIPLFLSEDEIRRLDREEAVQEGYAAGKTEMIVNLFNNGVSIDLISKSSNLSVEEVKKIINSSDKIVNNN